MQKTNSSADAKAEVEKIEALKKRAAKQAAKRELAPETFPAVECTVLPIGDGKISMGEHVAGLGTAHYEEGETFTVITPIALALYKRGYVNFEGARQLAAEAEDRLKREALLAAAEAKAFEKAMEQAGG